MTTIHFTVIDDSPLIDMTIQEVESKYKVKIKSYKTHDESDVTLSFAFPSMMIKPGFVLEVCGENTYDIFRDATGYYEIDA